MVISMMGKVFFFGGGGEILSQHKPLINAQAALGEPLSTRYEILNNCVSKVFPK